MGQIGIWAFRDVKKTHTLRNDPTTERSQFPGSTSFEALT